jgi:hypothetical protein
MPSKKASRSSEASCNSNQILSHNAESMLGENQFDALNIRKQRRSTEVDEFLDKRKEEC